MNGGLAELILHGKVSGITIGSRVDEIKNNDLKLFQGQEKDIPSLYSLNYQDVIYEISCFNETVVGISVKLDLYLDILFKIEMREGQQIDFGYSVDLVSFIKSLNNLDVDWSVDENDTGEKAFGILMRSNTKLMYSFEKEFFGFYQVLNFNWDLYNTLRKIQNA